jgi:hypothetical protein
MWWIAAGAAWADTWGPYEDGFVSPSRDDAPTDAVVLYAANYLPEITATDSGGVEQPLESVYVTGVGAPPRVAVQPPAGGWQPGETYTLSASGYTSQEYAPDTVATFTFTAGSIPSPVALAATVTNWSVGEWSEDEVDYPWGCCAKLRTVEVDVERDGADPWSWTEIVGQFQGPSQITTQEIHMHLDVAVGSTDATLSFVQWRDEDTGPVPACFDVVAVNAAGVAGPSESLCAMDDEVTPGSDDSIVCGCATTRGALPWVAVWLAALTMARRASRPGAAAAASRGPGRPPAHYRCRGTRTI